MLYTQNKIKFSLQRSKLLKIVLFITGSIFFVTANAVLSQGSDQTYESKSDSSYFLDMDSLQPRYNPNGIIDYYIEKDNPNAVWVLIPIKSRIRDYYKIVASVVAADLHKKIDEQSLVPPTKFLIEKNTDNNHYQLLGSGYKKSSFTTSPIMEIMEKINFDNDIYRNNNVERNVGIWSYLGLPISPDPAFLGVSKDNKLIRYDYKNSFEYEDPEISEYCFCTSDFLISNFKCNINYIEKYKQQLFSNYEKAFEEVISKIRNDSKKYLDESDFFQVNQALGQIINNKKRNS